MATKAQIEKALKLIEQQREAAAAAAAAEQQAQDELQMKLGEVLIAAAQKPRTKWAEFRSKPLTDLLAELGLIDAAASDDNAADSADTGGVASGELGDGNDDETTVSLAGREPIQDGQRPAW